MSRSSCNLLPGTTGITIQQSIFRGPIDPKPVGDLGRLHSGLLETDDLRSLGAHATRPRISIHGPQQPLSCNLSILCRKRVSGRQDMMRHRCTSVNQSLSQPATISW